MLSVYVAGSATPLAPGLVTVDANGVLQVPLFRRTANSAPWERIDRIDIALSATMFEGLALNATPTTAPAGTQRNWVETRPGVLEPVTWRTLLPLVAN